MHPTRNGAQGRASTPNVRPDPDETLPVLPELDRNARAPGHSSAHPNPVVSHPRLAGGLRVHSCPSCWKHRAETRQERPSPLHWETRAVPVLPGPRDCCPFSGRTHPAPSAPISTVPYEDSIISIPSIPSDCSQRTRWLKSGWSFLLPPTTPGFVPLQARAGSAWWGLTPPYPE